MTYYSHEHTLIFAREVDNCPGNLCPVEQFLRQREDVINWVERDNDVDKEASESRTRGLYKLNLDTPDIGNKFVEVYKEAMKICEQCRNKNQNRKR